MKDLAIAIRNYNRDNYKDIINSIKKVGFKNVFIEWYNNDLLLQEDIRRSNSKPLRCKNGTTTSR